MQLAILIVLVIIAVVLAPWLFSVAVSLIALYGVWVVVAAVGAVIGLLILAILLSGVEVITKTLRSKRPSRTEQMISDANQKFRAKETEDAQLEAERSAAVSQSDKDHKLRNYRPCPNCQQQMPNFGLFCPHCGKDPKSLLSNN